MNEVIFSRDNRRGAWDRMLALIFGANAPMVEAVDMPIGGLGSAFVGKTIAHVADLHYGVQAGEGHLRRCVEAINALTPDYVAITGDFVTTAHRCFARRVAGILRRLAPNVATLACLGNHDYGLWHPAGRGATGMGTYLAGQLADAGVQVLLDETRTYCQGSSALQFVGVHDCWARQYRPERAFEGVIRPAPAICLCHNPDEAPRLARMGAQWILSGHTHGKSAGRTRLSDLLFPTAHKHFVSGQYPLSRGQLYVNRGLLQGRRDDANHRPEITLFTLRAASAGLMATASPHSLRRGPEQGIAHRQLPIAN
jgi:predicted MPP superfamily phosphohydrolase